MPKDNSGAGVRVSWTTNPQLTLKLLTLIKKEKIYRQVFFPRSSTLPKDRHLYARAAVTEFFRKDEWMRDAERRGLAIWDATERAWRPTKAWGSTISNPIDARITLLKSKMSSGYYKTKYQIADQWTSFDDIPSKSKRATFRASHPYYFLLKELCERGKKKGRADALEYRDMPKPNTGNSKRRKRSPSISSSSSSSTSDSDSDSESDASTRSSSSSSSIDTKPPQARKLRTSDTNTTLVPGTEVKPIIVTPPHQSLVSAQTPRRAPRSVEEVLMSLPRPAEISVKHEEAVLTDSDSESVESVASTNSGSSSVVFLSEQPPGTWRPKEAKGNATPESMLSGSDEDNGSTVSENSEASCASGEKQASREIDETHQRGLEDGSDITFYKEYDNERVLDPAQLATLASMVLRRRFKHSDRSLSPRWYTSAVVDWMSDSDPREKYIRYRATLEMGWELISRWSRQSTEADATMNTWRFFFPPSANDDIILREMSEWVLRTGGESFSDADEFIRSKRTNAAAVVSKRAVIGTSLDGHLEVKIWALKTCIDKLLHLFPYCYRDEILREKLNYFARTCRITPLKLTSKGALYVSDFHGEDKRRLLESIGMSSNFTISKTESRHRAITSGSAKGKWRKQHCIRISRNVIDPLGDTRLPHEGGYIMSPMGFVNHITELRAKKLKEGKTEERSDDVQMGE